MPGFSSSNAVTMASRFASLPPLDENSWYRTTTSPSSPPSERVAEPCEQADSASSAAAAATAPSRIG